MEENSPGRANNFSVLRLLFATLVILSHSFELIDGNRSREILTRIFGTISFGELAVDGFFIVSGFLIVKSFLYSDYRSYMIKRCLRIYPGFIVAFIFSILVCQYFSAGSFRLHIKEIVHNGLNVIFLGPPGIQDAFPGSFYGAANGAMWTISYEFHCYLLIMVLGFFGLLRKEAFILSLTGLLLLVYLIHPEKYMPASLSEVGAPIVQSTHAVDRLFNFMKSISIENPLDDIRFSGVFLAGSCFYIFRNKIIYRNNLTLLAAVFLVLCMFSSHLAQPALAVFGGYLIFWFALHVRPFTVSWILNKTDLSYGIYLYAWPVQKALISLFHTITPLELFFATFVLSGMFAYLSWTFIEKPCLNLKAAFISSTKIRKPVPQSV